jgi:cytochrome c-type biogenesis protein
MVAGLFFAAAAAFREGHIVRTKAAWQIASLLLLLAITVASGCDSGVDKTTTAANSDPASQTAANSVGGKKGDQAPEFTLKRLAGGDLSLISLRGNTVIVDFWDTWCGPCRRALPDLQLLSQTYAGDLVVVGVALGRKGEAEVRTFVEQYGLTFEMVLLDFEGKVLKDFGGIQSIPTTFLIGADGVIREKWVGAADKSVYEAAVLESIASRPKAG